MRVVLDTNVLLVSIPKLSKYRPIFENLIEKKYTLIISNEILTEYEEIITRQANEIVAQNIVKMLVTLSNVEKKEIYYNWHLIKSDEDDNKFADCAVAGNADYLVTGDKTHILPLKKYENILIVDVSSFYKIII